MKLLLFSAHRTPNSPCTMSPDPARSSFLLQPQVYADVRLSPVPIRVVLVEQNRTPKSHLHVLALVQTAEAVVQAVFHPVVLYASPTSLLEQMRLHPYRRLWSVHSQRHRQLSFCAFEGTRTKQY